MPIFTRSSPPWRNKNIPEFYRTMVPLQIDRARVAFIAIQRSARYSGYLPATNHRLAIKNDRYQPAHQRDIITLPFARRFRRRLHGSQEPIDRSHDITRRLLSFCKAFDLQFITSPQIHAAVTILRTPEFDMQFEIVEFLVGHQVAPRMLIP